MGNIGSERGEREREVGINESRDVILKGGKNKERGSEDKEGYWGTSVVREEVRGGGLL